MAAPSWDSKNTYIADPADQCSWLFKIEVTESMLAYYLLNSIGFIFTNGNALKQIKLFMAVDVYLFFLFIINRLWTFFWSSTKTIIFLKIFFDLSITSLCLIGKQFFIFFFYYNKQRQKFAEQMKVKFHLLLYKKDP